MNIRMMAQNQLMQSGFNVRGSSFAPPAWQNNNTTNQQQNNFPASNAALRAAGSNIQNAMGNMTGRQSALNTLEGRTTDADVATVRVDNSRTIASMPPQNTTIDVRQTATAQANAGEALVANERAVDVGSFNFAIESGGRTHNFNINVAEGDDNATIQRRMAEAVNARDIGVRATMAIEGTGEEATTRLTLTGTQTGANNTFTVIDEFSGNIASAMGVAETSQEAQNAVFSLNGGFERTSQSNDVNIGAGITATLQGEGTTQLSFARNTQQAIDAATNLVNSLNSALRNTNAQDGRGSERFVSDIQGMNRAFANSLSRVGINVQGNGQLSIDEARMQRAAADGSLEQLFDRNSGFGGRAERISSNAASGAYRNAPAPVNISSPNTNFNFGNVDNMWSIMNLFV